MSNNMKEISRRVMVNDNEGLACGPSGVLAADAEMAVLDEGKTVFLHAQWVSEAPDILHEATTESVYDVYEKLNRGEGDFDALIAERDRISGAGINLYFPGCVPEERYARQFEELDELLCQELEKNGYSMDDEDEEDE